MGLLSTMRKRRRERKAAEKAAAKAARYKAKAQVKADAELERRKEAYLRKTAKQVRKADAKELKARRKHEQKMATSAVQQLKEGRFNAKTVGRYATAARVATPIAVPLLYRLLTQLRSASESTAAQRAGVDRDALAKYADQDEAAAAYRARIDRMRDSLDKNVPSGFSKDVDERLDDLDDAVKNSASMTEAQARHVLKSVDKELDLVEAQLRTKKN